MNFTPIYDVYIPKNHPDINNFLVNPKAPISIVDSAGKNNFFNIDNFCYVTDEIINAIYQTNEMDIWAYYNPSICKFNDGMVIVMPLQDNTGQYQYLLMLSTKANTCAITGSSKQFYNMLVANFNCDNHNPLNIEKEEKVMRYA